MYFIHYQVIISYGINYSFKEKNQERKITFAGDSLFTRWDIFMVVTDILTS